MPDPITATATAVGDVASAAAVMASALQRDEVAQRIATAGRVESKRRRGSIRWRRELRRASKALANADEADDVEAMIAALLVLRGLLGDSADAWVRWARETAEALSSD